MVLVDTSIWVAHLKYGHSGLKQLLGDGEAACHPFIIGELACGTLENRKEIISLLQTLPQAQVVEQPELLTFIERRKLYAAGIGFVDVHLLAASLVSGFAFWTHDRRLNQAAKRLEVAFEF